jgi:hypothetical protein
MPSRFPNEGGSPANTSDAETRPSEIASSGSLESDGGTRFPPNSLALAILEEVKARQKDRRETDASRTEELVREARAGGQYGYEPVE